MERKIGNRRFSAEDQDATRMGFDAIGDENKENITPEHNSFEKPSNFGQGNPYVASFHSESAECPSMDGDDAKLPEISAQNAEDEHRTLPPIGHLPSYMVERIQATRASFSLRKRSISVSQTRGTTPQKVTYLNSLLNTLQPPSRVSL